jgi:hypothetical protein
MSSLMQNYLSPNAAVISFDFVHYSLQNIESIFDYLLPFEIIIDDNRNLMTKVQMLSIASAAVMTIIVDKTIF